MKNYNEAFQINHNSNQPYIPNHLYKVLITQGSGLGKIKVILNLKKKKQITDIENIYLYFKGPFELKYQLLFDGKKLRIKRLKNPKAFIDYSEKK